MTTRRYSNTSAKNLCFIETFKTLRRMGRHKTIIRIILQCNRFEASKLARYLAIPVSNTGTPVAV
jgi:hypothetical protein